MTESAPSSAPPDISIILPVYNVGEYVEACLESLLRQDFDGSFEMILVDDKSTDNSLEICRGFAERHPGQVRLIACETNGGVSVARNIGGSLPISPRSIWPGSGAVTLLSRSTDAPSVRCTHTRNQPRSRAP